MHRAMTGAEPFTTAVRVGSEARILASDMHPEKATATTAVAVVIAEATRTERITPPTSPPSPVFAWARVSPACCLSVLMVATPEY
jgi:hypothetical protein